jgi:hypothetical protein
MAPDIDQGALHANSGEKRCDVVFATFDFEVVNHVGWRSIGSYFSRFGAVVWLGTSTKPNSSRCHEKVQVRRGQGCGCPLQRPK